MSKDETSVQHPYYNERMQLLGITEPLNQIAIEQTDPDDTLKTKRVNQPIFRPHEKGIEIMVYSLSRHFINYTPENARWKKRWSIIRLEHPITKDDGSVMKYLMPKGAGSYPFFPPGLVAKYEAGQAIDTLFLTEGYFKAFKGYMHGMDIVGLPSITHLMEKGKGTLHTEILSLILTCHVQRVVWLTDGDCLDIPSKLTDENNKPKDLYKRPFGFYNSIVKFKQLLDDYEVDKYFMHIDSENIAGHPKGLDDLLIAFPDHAAEIVTDLKSVSRPGPYAQRFNITAGGLTKVRNYFHLGDVTDFYLFHSEKRKDLKDAEFVWNGTQYAFDEKENRCTIIVPAASRDYFRVGDYYYKFVMIPNQHKNLERVFMERKKGTIIDDHDKLFLRHIPKYEAFCNVPDHVNFQQTMHGCFNVYSPLDFGPDEDECTTEDCPTIISFLAHIFGHAKCRYGINGSAFECSSFDLGLDYMQLLYQRPDEKLPIICLVSKENNTGKSTFGNFLRLMLGANVAIVGNQDFAGDFNSHWATKLVVVCDETKIDKQHVVEKVKMLSTAKKIIINSKGKNQTEIDCFIKFVLISNNEDSFITASDEDIRFWVLKVPKLKEERPNIMDAFIDELPAFLSYLSRRKMATAKEGRMWFHPQLIRTDALKNLIDNSMPGAVKELRQFLKDMFLDFGLEEIMMTRKALNKECFNNKHAANYLEKILKDNLKVEPYHELEQEDGETIKKYRVLRYTYPKYEWRWTGENRQEPVRMDVQDIGRPYVFYRKDFLTPTDMEVAIQVDERVIYESAMSGYKVNGKGSVQPASDPPPF